MSFFSSLTEDAPIRIIGSRGEYRNLVPAFCEIGCQFSCQDGAADLLRRITLIQDQNAHRSASRQVVFYSGKITRSPFLLFGKRPENFG